jgi:hypothetical protein
MKLRRKLMELGLSATNNFIQIEHRKDAIEYAVVGIKRQHDAVVNAFGGDKLTTELEGTMQAWVIETLLQGAYLREYHLWEKDCKAYFTEMAGRNRRTIDRKNLKGKPFTDSIKAIVCDFGAVVADNIFTEIEKMRLKVNVMKHEAGLEPEHFVSEGEYTAAVSALAEFWSTLANAEQEAH